MAIETDIDPVFRGFQPSGFPDRDLGELATIQDGVIEDDQLLALGLSRQSIQRRVDVSRLHRITWASTPSVTEHSRCARAGAPP